MSGDFNPLGGDPLAQYLYSEEDFYWSAFQKSTATVIGQGGLFTGTWTTTGPSLSFTGLEIPNQLYVEGTQNVGAVVNLGDGCRILGPFNYVDENGVSHDLNLRSFADPSVDTALVAPYAPTYPSSNPSPPCQGSPTSNNLTVDGSAMLTSVAQTSALSGNSQTQIATSDAAPLVTVTYPDGKVLLPGSNGVLEDTNGNTASRSSDSVGRSLVISGSAFNSPFNGVPLPGSLTFSMNSATGGALNYTAQFANVSLGSFTMPHPANVNAGTAGDINDTGYQGGISEPTQYIVDQIGSSSSYPNTNTQITSIQLPDGNSYTFQYDPTYGTVSRIGFPTGGHVRFVWGIRAVGELDTGMFNQKSTLAVTDAYVSNDSGGEDHWTYSIPSLTTPTTASSTITAPDGTSTQYTGAPFWYSSLAPYQTQESPTWQETLRKSYSASGTLIESVATSYTAGGLPANVATTLYDGASPLQQQTAYTYTNDSWHNLTEEDESGFYGCTGSPCSTPSAPPSGWLRKTSTTYQYQNSPTWAAAHIVNKPSQVLVTDGNSHPYSLTVYGYDEYGLTGSSGILNHDDVNYGPSSTLPRGNRTSERRCAVLQTSQTVTPATASASCSQWLITKHYYDIAGQVTSTIDPNGNTTLYSYTDRFVNGSSTQPTDGYPTTITSANGATDQYSYYFNTGSVASHVDWNANTTTYLYSASGGGSIDPLNRLKQIVYPSVVDGSTGTSAAPTTNFTYTDTPNSFQVQEQHMIDATGRTTSVTTTYDGLGRPITTDSADPLGDRFVTTSYNNMGRVQSVTNPYRSLTDPTYGTTTFTYDSIGRKTLAVEPDNSTLQWCYDGASSTGQTNCHSNRSSTTGTWVDHADENGNDSQTVTDGLGRSVAVVEPNPTGAPATPTLETDYSYDVLNNLLSVNQLGNSNSGGADMPRARTFTYDSVSRLLTAANPEAGTITYTYDADSNLHTKTDARGVVTSYSYDGLNRLLSKVYTNALTGSLVSCYTYDSAVNGKGKLGIEWTKSGSCSTTAGYTTMRTFLAYDAMGRLSNEQQCALGHCSSGPPPPCTGNGNNAPYYQTYCYDLAGNTTWYVNGVTNVPGAPLVSGGYPITFAMTYDAASRPLAITSPWNDANHPASLFTVNPSNGYSPADALQNFTLSNNLSVAKTYDNRLRVTGETATAP
jgi:YD repeat-containing protein